jgi:hypothetical protein
MPVSHGCGFSSFLKTAGVVPCASRHSGALSTGSFVHFADTAAPANQR